MTYKIVSGINVDLDLYLPRSPKLPHQLQHDHLRPALVYFHGGGLTVGEKTSWFPTWLHNRAIAAGFAFISANYRLLPPASGHHILEDIIDLFQFIHTDINDKVKSHGIVTDGVDAHRIVVAGTSAGGLCAYLAGIHARPRPRAVLSMYGMGGDFFTPHYLTSKTAPFFRGRELLDPESFSDYLHPNSNSLLPSSSSSLSYYGKDHAHPGYPSNPRMLLARLYLQLGTLIDYYTGEHEPSISETLRNNLAHTETAWRPLIPSKHWRIFPQLNLSEFPPTFFIHGSEDTAVPIHESQSLHHALDSHKIPTVLRACEGMEHSFDYEPCAEQKWSAVFDEAFQFVRHHLSSGTERMENGISDI